MAVMSNDDFLPCPWNVVLQQGQLVLGSNCTVLYCTALYCAELNSAALHYTTLHCIVLHYTALYLITQHCTVVYCTPEAHCPALHCTGLKLQVPGRLNRQLIKHGSKSGHVVWASIQYNVYTVTCVQWTLCTFSVQCAV